MEKSISNLLFFSVVVAALVSAVVSFLLNIFLERYKFKNQYRQIYSQQKLEALEELAVTLFKMWTSMQTFSVILHDEDNISKTHIEEIVKTFNDSLEQLLVVPRGLVYLSPKLEEEIVEFWNAVNSQIEPINKILLTLPKDLAKSETSIQLIKDTAQKLKENEKFLIDSLVKITEGIKEEMKENPFKMYWPRKVPSFFKKYFSWTV